MPVRQCQAVISFGRQKNKTNMKGKCGGRLLTETQLYSYLWLVRYIFACCKRNVRLKVCNTCSMLQIEIQPCAGQHL